VNTYLEAAAAQLDLARAANERRSSSLPSLAAGNVPPETIASMSAEVDDRRLDLAAAYTRLAAIADGLPPCLGHPVPDPGQESS
jgi:hypothetical protein